MSFALYQIDAFTDVPFKGNPAAVCLMDQPREADWMQAVAQEMNLSETAFVLLQEDVFGLRWFTPQTEIDLCGHATLASAHALWQEKLLPVDTPAQFDTRSGLLVARRRGEWIELDFPAQPSNPADAPEELLEGLGLEQGHVEFNAIDYLVEVDSMKTFERLQPDMTRLAKIPARGVAVTCRGEAGQPFDFVSRFFAPAVGIEEDPVTGSAHCCLGPYWGARLNKTELTGYQASARGGVVRVRLAGDRVALAGQATSIFRGQLF